MFFHRAHHLTSAKHPHAPPSKSEYVCSGGITGVESFDGTVCCPTWCGECSTEECSMPDFALPPDECCPAVIAENRDLCDDKMEAPCVLIEGESRGRGVGRDRNVVDIQVCSIAHDA